MPLDAGRLRRVVSGFEGGVRIAVRAQPKSSRDSIVGVVEDGRGGDALKVAIAAAPIEGEANAALVVLFAKLFGVAKRDVVLITGKTGRNKLVEVRGVSLEAACALLGSKLLG